MCGVFLCQAPSYFLRYSLSLNLELAILPRLAGQEASSTLLIRNSNSGIATHAAES